jgi:glutathione S-transferase
VLAGKPYVDVLHTRDAVAAAVAGRNPFKQLPFVITPGGDVIIQTLAIMHHAGHGTSAWPAAPAQLTRALGVAVGAYDLFQAFGAFPADDLVAKKKFEERRAPQYLTGLGALYEASPFAAGDVPCFADCLADEALAWVVRRNDVCRGLYEARPSLVAFRERFAAVPAVGAFKAKQTAARAVDDSV